MLRKLQLGKLLGYVVVACVALALWQGFHGNLNEMADKAWQLLQDGANIVTHLWNSLMHAKSSTGSSSATK